MAIQRKGATPLALDNTELRRELHRADRIIDIACQALPTAQIAAIQLELVHDEVTIYQDPLGQIARQQAMHRITPKCDYMTVFLIVAVVALGVAWSCSQTQNELLQAEAGLTQAPSLQGEPYER